MNLVLSEELLMNTNNIGPVLDNIFQAVGISNYEEMNRKVITQSRLKRHINELAAPNNPRLQRWLYSRTMNIYRSIFNLGVSDVPDTLIPNEISDAILGGILVQPTRLSCCNQHTSKSVISSLRSHNINICPFCRASPLSESDPLPNIVTELQRYQQPIDFVRVNFIDE